jgi:dTDP-4-dehydrorhamnose 3,5-epimerase
LRLRETPLQDVYVVETEPLHDARGFFARTFDAAAFEKVGAVSRFDQQSIAFNDRAGTIRGLHYQLKPYEEAKLVRCTSGALFDVVVDLRTTSPTFGRWFGMRLDGENRTAVYVPPGCAHGYQTLLDRTEAVYAISAPYVAELARGVNARARMLAIPWPLPFSVISGKDAALPELDDAELP